MAHEKSFEDLVAEAPSADAETVTVVGRLAKSPDPGKFVLHLADGRTHALPTSAVKRHTVLGNAAGHAIVQIDVEPEHLPAGERVPEFKPPLDTPQTWTWWSGDHTHPYFGWDTQTNPWFYEGPYAGVTTQSLPGSDVHGTIQESIDPGSAVYPALSAGAPFSLATQHQIPPQQLLALNALTLGGVRPPGTGFQNDGPGYGPTGAWWPGHFGDMARQF